MIYHERLDFYLGQFEDVLGLALSYYLLVLQEYFLGGIAVITRWYCGIICQMLAKVLALSANAIQPFAKISCTLPCLLPVRRGATASDVSTF